MKPKSGIPVKRVVEDFIDDDTDSTPGSEERDEHGQSMLHFAAARQHGKNALFQLIEEARVSVTYRDEIYRTARDVSLQASQPENCKEIDRYVLSLASRGEVHSVRERRLPINLVFPSLGDYETFVAMVLDGYDHIVDILDADGSTITKVARSRGHLELASYLESIRQFEVS